MKKIYTYSVILFFSLCFASSAQAQWNNGDTAPDWTLTDILGTQHHLYTQLDNKKTVFIDFSTIWCPPCWNYHQSGALETTYNTYGPNGSDEARVYFLESDGNYGTNCLYDMNCSNSMGNWVAGTSFPIIDLMGGDLSVKSDYNVSSYPSLFAVMPSKKAYKLNHSVSGASVLATYVQSGKMEIVFSEVTHPTCSSQANGSISIEYLHGYGNTTLTWSNGATGLLNTNLGPGTYTATLRDDNNVTFSQTFVLESQNPGIELAQQTVTNITCNGAQDGSIYVNPTGGDNNFTYLWNTGETTQQISGLAAGTYIVVITDGVNCTLEETFMIEEPSALDATGFSDPASCGQSNGVISLNIIGGTSPYSIDLGNGTVTDNTYIPNLDAGTYAIQVSDANNCTTHLSLTVETTDGPTASINAGGTELNCSTNTIELTAVGADAGSTVAWTKDGVDFSNQSTATVTEAGTYMVTITDASGCTGSASITINQVDNQPMANAGTDTEISCSEPSVVLSATASSGTYSWTTTNGNIVQGETTLTPTVNAAGTYTLTVTLADGSCNTSDEVVVSASTDLPTAVIASSGDITCVQSEITLNASGSSTGNNIAYNWTNSEGASIGTESTVVVNTAGTYTLSVTNTANGCVGTTTKTVNQNIASPSLGMPSSAELTCTLTNASISVVNSATGGTYTYAWTTTDGNIVEGAATLSPTVSAAGIYTLIATNTINGCIDDIQVTVTENKTPPVLTPGESSQITCSEPNPTLSLTSGGSYTYVWTTTDGTIVEGATTLTPTVSAVGTYTVVATDTANGCTNNVSLAVTENTTLPSIDAGTEAQITCTESVVSLSGINNSGDGNFSYEWTTTDGNIVEGSTTLMPMVDANGTYTLMVTNQDNGCSSTDMTSVSSYINTPVSDYAVSTTDKTAQFSSSASGENITYAWDFGDGNTSTEQNPSHSYADYGDYEVCLSITNECGTDEKCTSISINNFNVFASANITEVTCNGGTDGAIDVEVNNENTIASYAWSNGATTQDISNLEAGDYTLVITSTEGITQTVSFEVVQPDALSATSVKNEEVGSIDLSVVGGVTPYTYAWDNGATTEDLENLESGTYIVTITDANGCVTSHEVTIVLSSVEEIDHVDFINVYPNPVHGLLTIDLDVVSTSDISIQLYDLLGSCLLKESQSAATKKISIDMNTYVPGSYLLVLTTSEGTYSKILSKK